MDWYGSNLKGIDRDRTPEAVYPDEVLDVVAREEDEEEENSDGEWSRPTCSDASRSPSPKPSSSLPPSTHLLSPLPPLPPLLKRKASGNIVAPRKVRKGSKRSKPVPIIFPETISIMLKLPPYIPETR